MKIAEYIDIPLTERAGGVGTYINSLTREFSRLGHDVIVIDGSDKPRLFSNRHLVHLCDEADIHHFHEPSTAFLTSLAKLLFKKIKCTVVTFHAPISRLWFERLYSLSIPILYRKARMVLTSTKRNENYLMRRGIRPKVIPLWADEVYRPASDPYSKEPYVLSVCAVDDYHKYKNYKMISHLGKILRENFNIPLLHVGVHDFNLPEVVHYGPANTQDLVRLYQRAIALVLPSLGPYEGFGIVAAEALACATPVLVSDGCGISEFLDDYFVASLEDFERRLCTMVRDVMVDPRTPVDRAYQESRKFSYDNCRKTAELILQSSGMSVTSAYRVL